MWSLAWLDGLQLQSCTVDRAVWRTTTHALGVVTGFWDLRGDLIAAHWAYAAVDSALRSQVSSEGSEEDGEDR